MWLYKPCRGPNFANQLAITNSDAIPVINRMLTYSHYDIKKDVDSGEASLRTAKGQIHSQVSRLLLTLLEGVPRPAIVKRILGALDWKTFGNHLSCLQLIMSKGVLVVSYSINSETTSETFDQEMDESHDDSEMTMEAEAVRQKFRDAIDVPTYVADPEKALYAGWLNKEAFRFFTILETVRIAGEQLERSGDWSYRNCMDPLRPLLAETEMMDFFRDRIGQVEVIRSGDIERLFFWRPQNYLVERDRKLIEKQSIAVVDGAPRDDNVAKLRHFVDGIFEIAAVIDSQDQVGKKFGKFAGGFIPRFFAWFERTNPTMGLSLLICVLLMLSYNRCEGDSWISQRDDMIAGEALANHLETFEENLEGTFGEYDDNETCTSDGASLNRASFSRSVDWALPEFGPVGFELFMILGILHVGMSVMRALAFLLVRIPVLEELHKRSSRLDFLVERHGFSDKERDEFIELSVLVYGLPYMVPDETLTSTLVSAAEVVTRTHKPHLRTLDSDYVKALFKLYGEIGVVRVVPVKQDANEDGTYSGPNNSSWALVKFQTPGTVQKLMKEQQTSLHPKKGKGQPLGVRASLRPDAQVERVSIVNLKPEEVVRSTTLSAIAREAEIDYRLARKDLLATAAQRAQNLAETLHIGFLPISALYTFKSDSEVHESAIDIAAAVLGIVYSPLCFSYHLFKIAKFPGARIVVQSITHNVGRLAVALALCLLFAWIFAISGMIVFPELHDDESVDNPGGPCKNLLTCFFSYSYAGLTLNGLAAFLPEKAFPVDAQSVVGHHVAKVVWEVVFFVISTLIGSIITGIICDTFGELRTAQDDAAAYRASTNFVVGKRPHHTPWLFAHSIAAAGPVRCTRFIRVYVRAQGSPTRGWGLRPTTRRSSRRTISSTRGCSCICDRYESVVHFPAAAPAALPWLAF